MPAFVFAVSVTLADGSWRAHAHLTRWPVLVWKGTGRNGSLEGRSNAEISTRPILQLIKCYVCFVLIIAPTSLTCQLLLVCSRLSIIHGGLRTVLLQGAHTPNPLKQSLKGHHLHCKWFGIKVSQGRDCVYYTFQVWMGDWRDEQSHWNDHTHAAIIQWGFFYTVWLVSV